MLAELEKKSDSDFREGFDGGTFCVGSKGTMHTGCYGRAPRMLPDEAHRAFPVPAERIPRVKGSHFAHSVECCKGGRQTCADFKDAAAITEFLLLGHLAIRAGVGSKIEWDGFQVRCTNRPELNRHLHRRYRKGWET